MRSLRTLLVLIALQGLVASGASLETPSMDRRALLLGYSPSRLAATLGFTGLASVFGAAAVVSWLKPRWMRRFLDQFDAILPAKSTRIVLVVLLLSLAATVGIYVLFLFFGRFVPNAPYLFQIGVERFRFPMIWLVFIPVQLLIGVAIIYRGSLRAALISKHRLYQYLLFLVITISVLHWLTLSLRAEWLYQIPGWFWHFPRPKTVGPYILILPALIALGAAVIRIVIGDPERVARNLILIFSLAYILPVGFAFASGNGFEAIRLKYVNTPLSHEARLACMSSGSLGELVRDYDDLYGETFWLGTKPPGLLLVFRSMRDLQSLVDPSILSEPNSCITKLSRALAVVLPAVAALIVLPIYAVEKFFSQDPQRRYVSGIVYMSLPAVLLMPLIRDQFLYPLLFMASILALVVTFRRGSILAATIAGALIYVSIFVSFSLIPIIGLAIVWLLIDYLLGAHLKSWRLSLALFLSISLGFVILWIGAQKYLNYNPIRRFKGVLNLASEIIELSESPMQSHEFYIVNVVEFAIWSGWILLLLLGVSWIRSARSMAYGRGGDKEVFSLAFLLTVVTLIFIGQNRAEVGRIWIFLLAPATISASGVSIRLLRNPANSVILIFMLQLISTSLAWIYLDFR